MDAGFPSWSPDAHGVPVVVGLGEYADDGEGLLDVALDGSQLAGWENLNPPDEVHRELVQVFFSQDEKLVRHIEHVPLHLWAVFLSDVPPGKAVLQGARSCSL